MNDTLEYMHARFRMAGSQGLDAGSGVARRGSGRWPRTAGRYRMNPQTRQHGASPLAIMFVLVVVGFFGYIGLKLFPVYSESFRIDSSMKSLVENEDLGEMAKREIAAALVRRLQVNSVEFITTRNYPSYVSISEQGNGTVAVTVRYQRETPLVANLTLVADFEKTVED